MAGIRISEEGVPAKRPGSGKGSGGGRRGSHNGCGLRSHTWPTTDQPEDQTLRGRRWQPRSWTIDGDGRFRSIVYQDFPLPRSVS